MDVHCHHHPVNNSSYHSCWRSQTLEEFLDPLSIYIRVVLVGKAFACVSGNILEQDWFLRLLLVCMMLDLCVWLSFDLLIHRCVSVWQNTKILILCSLKSLSWLLISLYHSKAGFVAICLWHILHCCFLLLKKLPFFSLILFLFICFFILFCQIVSFYSHPPTCVWKYKYKKSTVLFPLESILPDS